MQLKQWIPVSLKARARRVAGGLARARLGLVRVEHRAAADNIYHCCVHKTASQWVRAILSDPVIYRYSGLQAHHYQSEMPGGGDARKLADRRFDTPFPRGTIVTPLYIAHEHYRSMPKPQSHRAFFVGRDPRDILISWYFSARYTHGKMGDIAQVRSELEKRPVEQGLLYLIEHVGSFGLFDTLESWVEPTGGASDGALRMRFEELTGEHGLARYRELFDHLGIAIPDGPLAELLERHSFDRKTGRKQGDEDRSSHYRRGVAGDWRNHFSAEVLRRFETATGGLVERMGYA